MSDDASNGSTSIDAGGVVRPDGVLGAVDAAVAEIDAPVVMIDASPGSVDAAVAMIDAPVNEIDAPVSAADVRPPRPDAAPGTPDAAAPPLPDAAVAAGCQSDNFLDVAQAPGPGAGYAAPTLSVSCTTTTFTVKSNGMPTYTFRQTTPNALSAQNYSWTLPRSPTVAATTTTLENVLGPLAVSVAGTPIFGPTEAAQPANQAYGDPVYNGLLDDCDGHTAPQGVYHLHALSQKCLVPSGLVAEPWTLADPSTTTPSPIIGYAFDGFPIYGPYECVDVACSQVVEMKSSYVRTGDPTTYVWKAYEFSAPTDAEHLDACNGHVGPNGDYHYHGTLDFPYTLGCYAGTSTVPTHP